ncbi:NADH:flavin oxidoreductase/NADH oxidase [Rhodococcus rhodochrous]|uniref:NADH:flavin oxidoreductase/NADH oxidase n=1 Tax=Rhodococcus rhodochrous TaxID=1829 RepID=UPI000316C6B3|nr:NADH:flavin oxidoreductase/NADH oxidase [Rhodococcus rhodochrous]
MPNLFDPIDLGPLTLTNRIVIPPMCQYSAHGGLATDWHLIHIGSLALSGAALLIMEATAVAEEGRITPDCLGLWRDDQSEALAALVKTVRSHSPIRLGIQLSHAGRKASSHSPRTGGSGPLGSADGWPTIGPSAVPVSERWPVPTPLTADDMDRVVEQFVTAAKRAVDAGFDLIELHGAHGYLLSSFLSPLANQRTDEFGGGYDNRARFPLRVFDAVREAVPSTVALGVRVNGTDWAEGGITPDEACRFAVDLERHGADFIHVSSGGNARGDIPLGPAYQIPPARLIRRHVNIPVIGVGLISSPVLADELVADGSVDLVGVGRGHLHNPHWTWSAAEMLGHHLHVPYQYARARTSSFEPPKSWQHLGRQEVQPTP